MKNREMLEMLKRAEQVHSHLADIALDIVASTFDEDCCSIESIVVGDKSVQIEYERGLDDCSAVRVPIEWFDEGFDYAAAYREMKRKLREEQKKKEEAARKRRAAAEASRAAAEAKKEYKTYLRLKEKFEGGSLQPGTKSAGKGGESTAERQKA